MKRLLLLFLLCSAAAVVPVMAQPGPVSIRPDCFEFFTFTATGNSDVFDNRSAGCPFFAITYSSSGFSALSLLVQVAPDNAGVPGSWVTYTASSGVNPNTATTQNLSQFDGYFPWVRVQLTSKTGTGSLSGILYGWRVPAVVISGGGSTGCGSPCSVIGTGTAGAQAGGVLTVQGDPAGTAIPVSFSPSGTQNVNLAQVAGTNTVTGGVAGSQGVGGLAADGAAVAGSPVRIGGKDGSGNTQDLLTDTSGNLQAQLIGNGSVLSGQQSVTGSAVALATNTARNICVKALVSNLINVFVGPTGITTSTGYLLAPGESVCQYVTNTNLIFVIASTTGASVSWLASN